MAVVGLVLGTLSVLDVVAFALLALHDPVDVTRRAVLTVVVQVTSKVSLFAFTVVLFDIAASVATTPVLAEVGA
jgi:hypothetical protein